MGYNISGGDRRGLIRNRVGVVGGEGGRGDSGI